MPLTRADRRFIRAADRLKICFLGLAGVVCVSLLLTPGSQIHLVTTIVSIALCWTVWLTQRIINLVIVLDFELTKAIDALKRAIPEETRREFLSRH